MVGGAPPLPPLWKFLVNEVCLDGKWRYLFPIQELTSVPSSQPYFCHLIKFVKLIIKNSLKWATFRTAGHGHPPPHMSTSPFWVSFNCSLGRYITPD